jgi:hypothetical protein
MTDETVVDAGKAIRIELPTYQHYDVMRIVRACCRMLAGPDDMVIYRDAFRWKNDANEHVMPNHYESQSLQYLAEEHGYEIVHDFRHVGVVRRKA